MIPYPEIDPDIVQIGPFHLRWYGMMYVLGIIISYFLIRRQKRSREIGLDSETTQDLLLYLIIGLILGARIGYLFFYQYMNWYYYLTHPLEIIAVWHGGMSFHGGMIGAIAAGFFFCRKRKIPFAAAADSVIVTAPVGLGLGRIGNFINAELYGRVTDVPWAMVFPDSDGLPRHPSQLYEAFFEGLVLFVLLWLLRKREFSDGMMVVFFLFFYGLFRFFMEYFRAPDPQIGIMFDSLSMGQLLCVFMMLAGIALGVFIRTKAR